MCVHNLKFVALPVHEIIGVLKKFATVPGYAHARFSPKFLTGFCLDRPYECAGHFEFVMVENPTFEVEISSTFITLSEIQTFLVWVVTE